MLRNGSTHVKKRGHLSFADVDTHTAGSDGGQEHTCVKMNTHILSALSALH